MIRFNDMTSLTLLKFVLLLSCGIHCRAWVLSTVRCIHRPPSSSSSPASDNVVRPSSHCHATKEDWSVADDWSALSSENPMNSAPDSASIFNQDIAMNAAQDLETAINDAANITAEDVWIGSAVDEIHNSFPDLDDTPLYDTEFEDLPKEIHSMDDMGKEIAMLVRCNEQPEEMLISEGRALPPLSDEEKNEVSQLVHLTKEECVATDFLKGAVSKIFDKHAQPDEVDGVVSMGRVQIAQWMTECLKATERPVSKHDRRVQKTISDYAPYGTGRLQEEDLQNLYLSTIVGDASNLKKVSPKRHFQLRQPFIDAVWRDIRAHGMLGPLEQERVKLAAELMAKRDELPGLSVSETVETIMDECEISDWGYTAAEDQWQKSSATGPSSSHRKVQLASDNKTPLWVRDGEFIFVDEESCIGCMQCVNAAPNSFLMLESGRARTFNQQSTPDVREAVASCPVSCMHPVSYRELKEYEIARDEGDGRTDHKHLKNWQGHTPLYVAGIDSDNNHKSSWYHTMKGKCVESTQCPQKGCYDCPRYRKPGQNPYFQKQHKQAEHARAQHFIESGDVDQFRHTADL